MITHEPREIWRTHYSGVTYRIVMFRDTETGNLECVVEMRGLDYMNGEQWTTAPGNSAARVIQKSIIEMRSDLDDAKSKTNVKDHDDNCNCEHCR